MFSIIAIPPFAAAHVPILVGTDAGELSYDFTQVSW